MTMTTNPSNRFATLGAVIERRSPLKITVERGISLRKFVIVSRLASMAVASVPLVVAAHEGADETISGVVQKVNETAGKITLKHGPINSLGMDEGMTMVFSIDPASLKGIRAGDKVMFQPERANGQLTVTKIEKVK